MAARRHSPVCLGINSRAVRDTLYSQRVLPAFQQEVKPRTNNPFHGLLFWTNVSVRAFANKRTWILRDRSLLGVPVISLRCPKRFVVHKNCGMLSGILHIGVQANWRQKELRKYVDRYRVMMPTAQMQIAQCVANRVWYCQRRHVPKQRRMFRGNMLTRIQA